jgi:tRNA A37 threonylcarbamoyladenosine dehydratase
MTGRGPDEDRFSRIRRLVGDAAMERLGSAFVVVVGLGATGGYAVEALARAGVGRLRVIDFDRVRPTNINRQLHALESTLGHAKTDVVRRRIAEINPAARVEALDLFVHTDTMDAVLGGEPDLVIDAIDSFAPKVELLAACVGRGTPVLGLMGAALRTDPACIRTGVLAEVHHCPLAARVRKALRRKGVALGIPVVYSIEPVSHLPPGVVGEAGDENDDLHPRGRRRRVLGSLPTLTGIIGLWAANEAIRMILGADAPGRVTTRVRR